MSEVLIWVLGGTLVGFLIGLTGIGGGSLMTPFLAHFGMPLPTAVGTDLLYATITKVGGVFTYHRQNRIRWKIVFLLSAGSLPASLATTLFLKNFIATNSATYISLIKTSLGFMMIVTAALLIARNPLIAFVGSHKSHSAKALPPQYVELITVLVGLVIGVLVTLSSVGAGVLGTSALLFLYSNMSAVSIIATELAHAVPLTFVAGLGYWLLLGNVNFVVLPALLVGSLPGVYLGARLSAKVPQDILRFILILILGTIGLRYILID